MAVGSLAIDMFVIVFSEEMYSYACVLFPL